MTSFQVHNVIFENSLIDFRAYLKNSSQTGLHLGSGLFCDCTLAWSEKTKMWSFEKQQRPKVA